MLQIMESWGSICCPKLNIIVGCQPFECLLFFAKRNYQLLFSVVKPHVNINLFLNNILNSSHSSGVRCVCEK